MSTVLLAFKHRFFAIFSIFCGVMGWFASWELATEYVKKLKDPEYIPNCEFTVLVTCGPNMDSWQGSVFGFSNTFIGLCAFAAPVFVGFAVLAGAKFQPWFWFLYILGLTFGIIFVFWLSIQSVFVIGTLCPWCIVVWIVTIALFWVTVGIITSSGWLGFKPGKLSSFFNSWSWVLTLICYALIAFYAQIALNWVQHL